MTVLTRNFDQEIFGNVLQVWLMHRDAASSGESVDNAVHPIHCECCGVCCPSLQRKDDLRESGRQSPPLQDDAWQRMKWTKLLKDVLRCTPRRLCTTEKQHTRSQAVTKDSRS